MSTSCFLLLACLITVATSRPEISDSKPSDTNVGQIGATNNPILDYILNRNTLPPGGKREITHLQAFPATSLPKKSIYQRDPNKTPYENFNGFILAGRKPDVVESPVLKIKNANKTQVDVVPAIATIIRTFDEHGTLRSSVTRYEPAAEPSTRQQITWPYAGYFPVLIKDPFLAVYHALANGGGFSLSSLIEYGPDADICRKSEPIEEHLKHTRRKRQMEEREEVGKRRVMAQTRTTRLTVTDPEKGVATMRINNPETQRDEVRLLVRKGGVSIAGPGGFATAYTGGTAVVGPYGTVFKSPDGVAVAGPHSRIINITDDTNLDEILHMDGLIQADDIEARANLVLPPLSTILRPPVRGYDQRKKKPSKPDKEESEEENVGEEQEESSQESSDAVAINPPPEGSSVAEAKPVGLAIAGPGGVASSKPVAQAIVGPGGLAIARPVGTAVAGVEVEGSIPLGGQQQKQKQPQKKKPKQEYDNDPDTELQYVGGLSGPIGSPKPKHTPPETNYIGGLRGVVGNPLPKYETSRPTARQNFQFRLGEYNGKYGFLPFESQGRNFQKRVDSPTFFHGMIGANNMPASVYPLVYY